MDAEHSERLRRRDDRVLIARIAAAERWGHTADRTAATEPARSGLRAKFEREADPDGALSAQERARRADQLMYAHMLRMSRAAAQARTTSGKLGSSRTHVVFERMSSQSREAHTLVLGDSLRLCTQLLRHSELHARRVHRATGQGLAARDQIAATGLSQCLLSNLLGTLVRQPLTLIVKVLDVEIDIGPDHVLSLRLARHRPVPF